MGMAAACGLPLAHFSGRAQAQAAARLYDLPRFGNVHFLHFTDCHAQLLPLRFREPNVNLGVAGMSGRPPHLVGEALLRHFGIKAGTAEAHAFTFLDFEPAARTYGKVGGFAHLATLVKQLKADRPARCCSMAATPGRVRPPPCGPRARTWSMPANCWAWT